MIAKSWFREWIEASKTPERTAKNWWKHFQQETGETRTPAKAEDAKDVFFAWLQEAQEEGSSRPPMQRRHDKSKAEAEKAERAKQKRMDAITAAVKTAKDAGDTDLAIVEACNAGGLTFE